MSTAAEHAGGDVRGRAERLLTDFPYYAEHCLKVRPKAGGLVPLVLNRVQTEVHERLEAQLRETGKIRALVLNIGVLQARR